MNRIIFYFVFTTLFSGYLQAQHVNFIDENAFVTFSADTDNVYLDFDDDVTVSSTQNVVLRGKIYSEVFVVVKPNQNHTIVFKPPVPCDLCSPNLDINYEPPGTVIRPKAGGPGKTYRPMVVLYPVPVHTNLTFNVTNYTVVQYVIFDQMGVVKQTQNLTPTQTHNIDVSALPNGNYMLRLNLGNNLFFTKNFIKN